MSWRNVVDVAKKSQFLLRVADRLGRGTGRFRILDRLSKPLPAPLKPNLTGWESKDLAAIWIGHATVLLRIGGLTVLTDPVFSTRVGLGIGLMTLGPARLYAPAMLLSELPPIDLILLSHGHFDHLDRPTLRKMSKRSAVVTARGVGDLVSDLGFKSVTEIGWGETTNFGPLTIAGRQVAHWGARTFYDRHRGYNGYLIESDRHRVLYAGDTADYDGFADLIHVDLAIFGIGAYDPYIAAHATPEQVVKMAARANADVLLPMHHSTFRLSYEPMTEPMERLIAAADTGTVVVDKVGGQWEISSVAAPT